MNSKEKARDKLLEAVGNFVNTHGGNAVVAGNIRIIYRDKYIFEVVIKVTGSPPKQPTDTEGSE